MSVDIEAWHRDAAVWGEDALAFQPARFDSAGTRPQRAAYMPFGVGPHKCPAQARFGTRTVAMLVSALGRRLGSREGTLQFHDRVLDGDTSSVGLLPTGRGDMEAWELVLRAVGED